jgi:hypothetical protein
MIGCWSPTQKMTMLPKNLQKPTTAFGRLAKWFILRPLNQAIWLLKLKKQQKQHPQHCLQKIIICGC